MTAPVFGHLHAAIAELQRHGGGMETEERTQWT